MTSSHMMLADGCLIYLAPDKVVKCVKIAVDYRIVQMMTHLYKCADAFGLVFVFLASSIVLLHDLFQVHFNLWACFD